MKSIAVKSSPEDYQTNAESRCRARNCCRGFYDPVTFDVTAAPTGVVFENADSPESSDVDGVDEVSSDCYYCDIADPRTPDP